MDILRLERVLNGQRIHDCRQHTHVVAGNPVQSGPCQAGATKYVAAPDNDGDLYSQLANQRDFPGDPLDDLRLDSASPLSFSRTRR
jgi:hypothetical protein